MSWCCEWLDWLKCTWAAGCYCATLACRMLWDAANSRPKCSNVKCVHCRFVMFVARFRNLGAYCRIAIMCYRYVVWFLQEAWLILMQVSIVRSGCNYDLLGMDLVRLWFAASPCFTTCLLQDLVFLVSHALQVIFAHVWTASWCSMWWLGLDVVCCRIRYGSLQPTVVSSC